MKRKTKLQLPKSTRDILSVFNLSRTNQILRGRSPTFQIQVTKLKKKSFKMAFFIFLKILFRMKLRNNGLNCWHLKSFPPKLMWCLNLPNTMFIWSHPIHVWDATKKLNNPRIYVKPLGKMLSIIFSKSIIWRSPKLILAKGGKNPTKKIWKSGNSGELKVWKVGKRRNEL